jgi:outer membrane protein assembly factor BamE (lipoprotein component of BamABCDE complex)
MKTNLVVALSAALLSSACVSMGTNYDQDVVAALQPGMTRDEVIAKLGKPNSVATFADGRQQLVWVHSKGTMLGGASARSVALVFTQDGKLERTGQAQTNIQ